MTRLGCWWLGPLLLSLACTPSRGEPGPPATKAGEDPPKAPETPPTPKTPQPPDESRWTCATDQDCVQTCALGAVSATWLEANPSADECEDGCGWHVDEVRCQDGGCVTLNPDGTINESCTRRVDSPNAR